MLACINPWVRNSARTLKIKAFRLRKLPGNMGCLAFRSTRNRPAREISAAIRTPMNAAEDHPKFCPKDGIHSARLKKSTTKRAPEVSNAVKVFFAAGVWLRQSTRHTRKTAAEIPVQIQIMVRQP